MMLENIEILLEHRNLSVDGIFKFLKNNDNLNKLNFIEFVNLEFSNDNDYDEIIKKAFLKSENTKYFDKKDLELLNGYFSVFGKTDLKGQISNCRLYKEFFKHKLNELEAEENMKCKSTGTIIVGTGVLLIILLI